MPRRSTRHFGEADKAALLAALGTCRTACTTALAAAPIGEPVYLGAERLMISIDNLAEVLTGDREHFHMKPGAGTSTVGCAA